MVISILTTREYRAFSKIERDLKLSIKREIYQGFELTDTQPRQVQPKKKSLIEKKGGFDFHKKKVEKRRRSKNRKDINRGKK